MSTETKTTLYEHIKHLHTPRDVNKAHSEEQQGFNARVAVRITRIVGTMPTAYVFAVLAIVGLFAILGVLSPIVALLVAWTSQTFLQLCFLPILSVGQSVLSRHQELMAQEAFETTQRSYQDIEQIARHLDAQDQKILEILKRLDTQQIRPIRAVKKKTTEVQA